MNLIEEVLRIHNERELKMIRPIVTKIESLRPEMMAMSDEELHGQTRIFRERLADGVTLDDVLPEASATVHEVARRTLDMEHLPVQPIGGIVLHQGRITEMRTGEDKTLVSTCPTYLNALKGKGVQIVTVNDYLAKRDTEWVGQIHRFLGMTVGVILNDAINEQHKEAYACNITYVTGNELGFDYLRDNMSIYKGQLVLRDLGYCIIGEIDPVLIDRARTPLIISGQNGKSTKPYKVCDVLARQLGRGTVSREFSKIDTIMGEEIKEADDFVVDEKDRVINLTEQGVKKVREYFHIENLADPENLEIQHNIILALRTNNLMFRDRDYVVKDDEVPIVDEFTGRIMPGCRYSDGLHQAVEAKEYVNVCRESRILVTVTSQSFFNEYTEKASMTGTTQVEEKKFRNIYAMDVIVIPTDRLIIHKDLEDTIYRTKKEEYKTIVDEMEEAHKKGQPVLVGTIAIKTPGLLSEMLTKKGIPHRVLSAKFHELETEIVADAGIHSSVIIATNVAGRGTDIKLGEETKALGGFKIIGAERHESRRIDSQLRGHSGHQGDPGKSRFYLSLEDDLLRLFGSDRLMAIFETMGVPEGEQIEHEMLSNAIERAQMKIEGNNYGIREQLLKFGEVDSEQREVIYAERHKVLDGDNIRGLVLKMITDTMEDAVDISMFDNQTPDKWGLQELNSLPLLVIPLKPVTLSDEQKKPTKKNELKHNLEGKAVKFYETKEAKFPEPEQIREIERVVLLRVIDNRWVTHLDDVDALREGIGLQAYGQRDPVVEYKMQGHEVYESMVASIQGETTRILFRIHVEQKAEHEAAAKVTGTNKNASVPNAPKKRAGREICLNDPCPCDSGRKYKQYRGRIK